MDHPQKNDDVLLKDLSALIRELVNDLDDAARRITKKPAAVRLQNLQNTVYGIDAPVVNRRRAPRTIHEGLAGVRSRQQEIPR